MTEPVERDPDPPGLPLLETCHLAYPRLVAAFRALGLDREDAEDTAQDALTRLVEVWPRRRPEHPVAWTYSVGRNAAITRWRRRTVETRLTRLASRPAAAFDEEVATSQLVRDAVRRLPRRQREAIVHRYFLGLSVAESADSMGCAPGTVTALTHQALERLHPELSPDVTTPEVAKP